MGGWSVELTPELTAALQTLFDRIGDVPDADRRRIVVQLSGGAPPMIVRGMPFPDATYREAVEQFAVAPGVDATVLFVVLHSLNWLFYDDRRQTFSPAATTAFDAGQEATGRPTLAELAHRVDAIGGAGAATVWDEYRRGFGRRWPSAAVWPFVLANIDLVLAALSEPRWMGHATPFQALATVPDLPPQAVDQLFTFAVGRSAETRKLAQSALASVPGIVSRVAPALSDSRADARVVAARWLADLGAPSAVQALEAALAIERNDLAKAALLDALSALGRPVDRYLDAATVDAEAQRGLRGGVPKALAWLDLAAIPAVWWASGERVEPTTVLWLLALAVKGKSPAPDTLMRHYCHLLNTDDRQRLASFVLDSWIGADNRFHDGYGSHHGRGSSVIGAKGVLALVAACGGDDAVATANHFIHANYGGRAAESRSLIEMLAWNSRPAAIQSVLAIATRFRTPGLRRDAESQVAALAERRGWTTEELADRTAADGGFDADGILRLEFAPGDPGRTFTATVQPDLSVVLRGPEGKVVKSLPAPRQSDDQQSAAAAKKALSGARKLVKAAANVHTERLFAAMCSQRTWVFTDWVTYIARHPIVGQLARRLIWVADGVTLRPLDDGTLTDAEDDEVMPAPDAAVRLAHSLTVDADQHQVWRQHLIDYEVIPLFDQFRDLYTLPTEAARATRLTATEGCSLPYFTFRSAATARGYSRGAVGDGAVIIDYEKALPTIGVTVSLQFSGVDVSQTNETVTLESAYFTLSSTDGGVTRLGEVPPVLLSEVHNDLRQIAALAQTGSR